MEVRYNHLFLLSIFEMHLLAIQTCLASPQEFGDVRDLIRKVLKDVTQLQKKLSKEAASSA